MTNSKYVPKRRFKEFELDGEWEETKLRELFQYIGNAFVGTATPYYVESGHFYLESNNIKDGQINYNTEVFINDEFYQKQKNKWLQTGDMVMVQSGHVGHAAVIPENLNNSAAHALIMFRNPSENLESHFLNYQYQTTKAKEKIKTITTGNTIQHILASDMKEYKVYISNIKEQLKIGKFFQTIDSLITLHQHKLDKLKDLKKAYLSEMFPAEGERVPKRRFPGFEGEWEEKKLGEMSNITAGGDVDKDKLLTKGNYPVLANAHTNEGIIGYYEENYQIEAPAVTVTGRGDIGFAKARKENFTPVVRLLSIKSKHNVDFLAEAINQNKVIFESTGVPQLTIPKLSNYKIYFPTEVDEENSIGNFLVSLDSLITLQQQKLDKLNDLKKAYLNELFV
ncbi:restriction endonuclease subunit S [Streptococcus thermophilus]|uniref:restriction endonuclease subunit S n=1 Tax=Streptococcus thermophilus TaxID=1308 RepID=UPI00262A65B6|nr:restriction endonuclease subunit S [Streptococcus thermophilus]